MSVTGKIQDCKSAISVNCDMLRSRQSPMVTQSQSVMEGFHLRSRLGALANQCSNAQYIRVYNTKS